MALGVKGRDHLSIVSGVSVSWYFRPERQKHFSFAMLMHDLCLTRFLVAAHRFAAGTPDFSVSAVRICYELGASPMEVELDMKGKTERVSVVPDAWIMFEKLRQGRHLHWLPVLVEIDRGTMYRERIKRHIRSRVAFIESGEYERVFGTRAVVVAYATTGASGELSEARRKALAEWAMEALAESGREDWASVFRFASVSLRDIYDMPLFDDSIWYRPDQDIPVRFLRFPFKRFEVFEEAVSSSSNCSVQNLLGSRQPRIGSENAAAFCLDPQILVRGGDVRAGDNFCRFNCGSERRWCL